MNIDQAIQVAIDYLYSCLPVAVRKARTNYVLNPELQRLLYKSFRRLEVNCTGENIIPKDIFMLVESWCMAQGSHQPAIPLLFVS